MLQDLHSAHLDGFPKGVPVTGIMDRDDDDADMTHGAFAEPKTHDGWWRTLGAGLAYIRWVGTRLGHAEKLIREQEERIRVLEKMATQDELTGLLNRRGFQTAFDSELDRTARGHSEGGLMILIDLDNFKVINDTYGHAAGDAALKLVAKTLKANSRTMDACARLGGDEFVLLLANTNATKALTRAQSLMKQLNSLSLIWYGAEIPVRASLGLEDYVVGDTQETIFSAADSKLYESKRLTRGIPQQRYAS